MGRFIVRIEDYYLEWSTIVDAPVTWGMKLGEFKRHYRVRYGTEGMLELPKRLARVEKTGTSSMIGHRVADLVNFNRAGPNESSLTYKEIWQAYCLNEPIRDGWRPE